MKVEKKTEITVKLELTQEEALWLHGFVQNSLALSEDTKDSEMRKKFFDATDL